MPVDYFSVWRYSPVLGGHWVANPKYRLTPKNIRLMLKNLRERNITDWRIVRLSDNRILAQSKANPQ